MEGIQRFFGGFRAAASGLAAEVGAILRQETGADPQADAFRELAARYLQMPV